MNSEAKQSCAGLRRDGSACGQPMTRLTSVGWRCRHHNPDAPAPATGKDRPAALWPPVRHLRTAQDAVRLSSWAAIAAARCDLSRSQATAVIGACREFRQSLRDAGLVQEFERLKQVVAKLTAAAGKDRAP